MLTRLFRQGAQLGQALVRALRQRLATATKPAEATVAVGALTDLVRGRPALIAENALLRQQLLIVQPATLLRWHRDLFRRHWRWKSQAIRQARRAKVPAETIALIREMAAANRLWGAERIRGELRKVGIRVATTTVQRHIRAARPPRRDGQTWATFLRNHAGAIWACDFLPVTDLLFRQLYACFVVAHGSRHVVHVGVTRHPADAWVAQQLREATPFDQRPRYLIRDRDSKYGPAFARVAAASGITALRTAYRAPRQNATCERFLGSVRRACLDHALVLGEAHRRRVLREYVAYFNQDRPHQGLRQRLTDDAAASPVRRAVWATCGRSRCSVASTTRISEPRRPRAREHAARGKVSGREVPLCLPNGSGTSTPVRLVRPEQPRWPCRSMGRQCRHRGFSALFRSLVWREIGQLIAHRSPQTCHLAPGHTFSRPGPRSIDGQAKRPVQPNSQPSRIVSGWEFENSCSLLSLTEAELWS